jgi:ferredoxin-NADP reductase/predicted pyridoxine 5'-phosphate oxidase superfamily flavin-nucleotide-binding protein
MAFTVALPWNQGEEKMHHLLRVPPHDNPTSAMLTPQASSMLQKGPLLALGTLDSQSRPWTTLWGGSPGFSEPLGGGLVGTRTLVNSAQDPVVKALLGDTTEGELLQPSDGGKMLAGLAIDLMTRKRVKIAGRMIAGTVRDVRIESQADKKHGASWTQQKEIQLVTKIDQSLGNCPKYLNQYELHTALTEANLLSQGSSLTEEGKTLIGKSDMFFLATATEHDMDVNHRGGPPGFVRIISSNQLIYPEYSGNRLYQSLGNLQLNPHIGVTFPDYGSGDVLFITGTATILVGTDAADLLPGSTLAVKITITESRLVQGGLPFRGVRHAPSPYNPRLRTLAAEGNIKSSISTLSANNTARLVKITSITPTIARFTFSVPAGIVYSAGQWVALDFKDDLDIGYEHMRNDDPTSLNDDFVRTFTISSLPTSSERQDEFEITIKKVGRVTQFLFQQNVLAGYEVPILGVGGEFEIVQKDETITPFIAGGVGITPLLGQLGTLDLSSSRFKLYWTLRTADISLVLDTLGQFPGLAGSTAVFLTGDLATGDVEANVSKMRSLGTDVNLRRLNNEDLDEVDANTWYLCAGKILRKELLGWLKEKIVVFEDFDF